MNGYRFLSIFNWFSAIFINYHIFYMFLHSLSFDFLCSRVLFSWFSLWISTDVRRRATFFYDSHRLSSKNQICSLIFHGCSFFVDFHTIACEFHDASGIFINYLWRNAFLRFFVMIFMVFPIIFHVFHAFSLRSRKCLSIFCDFYTFPLIFINFLRTSLHFRGFPMNCLGFAQTSCVFLGIFVEKPICSLIFYRFSWFFVGFHTTVCELSCFLYFHSFSIKFYGFAIFSMNFECFA